MGLVAGLIIVACGASRPLIAPAGETTPPRASWMRPSPSRSGVRTVVLIVLDGVRPRDVFTGVERERAAAAGLSESEILPAERLVPNLHWLATRGGAALGHGAPISASGPEFVSLPGYAEILSGAARSGCRDNRCAGVTRRTIVEQFAATYGRGDPGAVAVFASWSPLDRVIGSDDAMLVSTGRGNTNRPELLADHEPTAGLYRDGERAKPYPGHADYRPDRFTAGLALRYLQARRPRFLFVSLGDADEHGHRGNYPGYLQALRHADRMIGEVIRELEAMSAEGSRTLLLVTSDHGRAADFVNHGSDWPESAESWLIAGGDAIAARGLLRFGARPYKLADIAPTIRQAAGLGAAAIPAGSGAGMPIRSLLFGRD